jgi:hypothetical protein
MNKKICFNLLGIRGMARSAPLRLFTTKPALSNAEGSQRH